MGFELRNRHIFGHIFYWFCKHWIKLFGKNLFKYSIHCFIITICITNCYANEEVIDKNVDTFITKSTDSRIRFSKYPKLVFKRDLNQNIDSCDTDEECNQNIKNTICSGHQCICSEGKRMADNNTCIHTDVTNDEHNQSKNELTTGVDNKSQDKPKEKYNGSHMLPIMIVLGVMFIGMCVALNLFSRARFRQSRGIFSKPHLIKFNNNASTKSSYKTRRTSPPNPNNATTTAQSFTVPESDLPKNGSYVSIALDS